MTNLRHFFPHLLLAAVVAALLLAPATPVAQAAIIIGFAILSWAFGLFPEPVTSLLFFLLVVLFRVAKPEIVFSGFTSAAWWLVFGGSITAVAVQTTGLGGRLADLLFRSVSGPYWRAVAAVAAAAVGLAFLMPSTSGRILLLMPVVLAFAEQLGLDPARPGYAGLVVTTSVASFMPPTTILPANVPNGILLGAAETIYGVKLTYGPYLLLHFPILGALKAVVMVWLVSRLFPEPRPLVKAETRALGPMSREEKRLVWLLAASLVLYATDWLHGISPAWISLGTGILCLPPFLGVVTGRTFSERVNVVTLVYVAGILGLGAVAADSGLAKAVSSGLLHIADLRPGDTAANVGIVSAIGAGLGLITTVTSVPAVLTPLAGEFAQAAGLPLLSVLMLEVVVFSTAFLPYEAPPIMIGLQLGRLGIGGATKLCLALAAVTLLVLFPLDYLWWRWLGYLP